MPVGFAELPVTQDFISRSEKHFSDYKKFFEEQSYGRARLQFTIPDRESWLNLNRTFASFQAEYENDMTRMTQFLLDQILNPDPTKFDAVFLITTESRVIQWGGMSAATYNTARFGQVKGVYVVVGGDLPSITHGLGHNLFYLQDLYIHDFYMKPGRDRWPMRHDIMGGGGPFSGWQRWLNGWLEDGDIDCASLTTRSTIYRLTPLSSSSGERLLVIPTSERFAWVAEIRNEEGPEGNGLFIYSVDTSIGNGNGPMSDVDGTLKVGGIWSSPELSISVVAESEKYLYISLTRI
jgi:hypothetical protein